MPRKYYLLNWVFLVGLLILGLNDHYWKWAYSNTLTGKLSDVVGLLILPFFLAYLWPHGRKWVVYISAMFFVFWKSPWSEGLLVAYNKWALIPITRVVDYSDLLALTILPVAAWLLVHLPHLSNLHLRAKRHSAMLLSGLATLVFMATSPPPDFYYRYHSQEGNIQFFGTEYKLKVSKADALVKIQSLGLKVSVDTTLIEQFSEGWYQHSDTLLYGLSNYYRISEMIFDEDTLRNIRFSLEDYASPDRSKIYLNALTTSATLDSIGVDRQLRRIYKRFLRRELVHKIK